MDIEKHDTKIGCSLLLILAVLIVIPSSTGYIDCRISCRRCHENTEHPSVLEVYCAMCEECKQRRRERMQGRATPSRSSVGTSLVRMRDGVEYSAEGLAKAMTMAATPQLAMQQADQNPQQVRQPQEQKAQKLQPHMTLQPYSRPAQRGANRFDYDMRYPVGCPTPPICSDSDDEPELLVHPSSVITTTTTTTTPPPPTAPPCPPVISCRKKKKSMPCMPCMPMCPCPVYQPQQQMYQPQQQMYQPQLLMHQQSPSTTAHVDYHYVYVGLPKSVLRSS